MRSQLSILWCVDYHVTFVMGYNFIVHYDNLCGISFQMKNMRGELSYKKHVIQQRIPLMNSGSSKLYHLKLLRRMLPLLQK